MTTSVKVSIFYSERISCKNTFTVVVFFSDKLPKRLKRDAGSGVTKTKEDMPKKQKSLGASAHRLTLPVCSCI